ncbi:MAG: acetylornithine transaminase [Desulfobacterales bacterium]|nr:acetylornithine transaminase [Desulfobacterales bacterium]
MKKAVIQQSNIVIAPTYNRSEILFVKGEGCTLWDSEGQKYTDFLSGIAVCNLGHSHPEIAQVIYQQAQMLTHVSNLFYTIPQVELASLLVEHSFADRVFFCNSGAEANEAAIKVARKYFSSKGISQRYKIIAMHGSFHGRTMATLSATGQEKVKKGFYPLLQGFEFVPYNQIEALKQKIDDTTCAVILELIQGEGGVNCSTPEFIQEVRKLCDEQGILLIFDEIQTGMGRTGKLFAYEHYGITPDIMTLAKALGNGLPIGAMLAKEQVMCAFEPGSHASTFGGTPLVTAAALQVLRIIERDQILKHCNKMGMYFKERLNWLKSRHSIIEEIRGLGLLLGLKLSISGAPIVKACLERGFIINCVQENVLRFVPPLIISLSEIDALVACLDDLMRHAS